MRAVSARSITVLWHDAGDGAEVALMTGDGAGGAPLAWGGRHTFDVGQAQGEAEALARAVRRAVVRGRGADGLAASGRLLFDLLLPGPVKAALRGEAGDLTIVADDRRWPWALLHDGATHLGLRWALGEVALGAQVAAAAGAGEGERLLVVADPAADLPAARYEGEALMREMAGGGGCDLRLGRLRRHDFLRIFRGYRLVHFAGHADPADDAGPAGWRLADGRVDAAALRTLSGGAAPGLVFANACRSALAEEVGDALLAAGVRHFVGTTVDLPDLPGADFAARFYGALRDGAPVGEALRRARVAAAEAGEATWAAYRLRGDPRTVYFRPRPAERWAPGVRQAVLLAVRRPHAASASADALAEGHQRWRAWLRDRVGRHGGRLLPGRAAVDRAVFGVPVTYEDDARRAARAALSIAREAPDAVLVLDAGPVVSTGADVVGAAALAVEAEAWRAPPGVFGLPGAVARLGAQARWGLPEDGRRGLIDPGDARVADEAPLVGRAAEIARIEALADGVLRERRAAAATVVGPAGIGKSRLLHALERRLAGRFAVVRGAGIPYDEAAPFAAAAGVIRGLCGAPEDAPPAVLRARLRALLERLDGQAAGFDLDVMPIDALLSGEVGGPALVDQLDALAALCGLDPEAGAAPPDPAALPGALRLLVEAASTEAPLAVMIEDVHWLPDVGRAVVDALVGQIEDHPVLVVSTGRPALAEQVGHWFERPRHTRVDLGPLSEREAEAVLRETLAGAPGEVVATLLARAEGNPLFLRELALARQAGDDGAPPPTIEAVMQARLDRLPPFEREVLRAAAVLGRTFWRQGVERLLGRPDGVDGALAALERRRFVQSQPPSELPGQAQWRFNHALMVEVVYHGLAGRARAAWHGRAALWLSDEVDAGPDRWARIAGHRAAAGDHARAAEAWLQAAERARQTSAAAEARRAWRAALTEDDAAGGALDAEVRAEAELQLADLERGAGDLEAAAALLDAAVARSVDPVARARRSMRRSMIAEARGDLAAAWGFLAAGRALLEGRQDEAARLVALDIGRYEGWLACRDGDAERAVALLRDVLAEVPDGAVELRGLVLNGLGVAAYGQGDFEAAERAFRRALALFEQIGEAGRAATCFNNLGMVAGRQGDVPAAVGWYERAVRLHVKRGDRTALAQAYNNLGSLYGDVGDYPRAARYLREVVRIREGTGHGGLALGYANLGEVYLKQGRAEEARGFLERAIALCTEGRGPGYLLPDVWRMLAEFHLGRGDVDEARAAAREALAQAEERGDRTRVGAALRVLGEALAAAGDAAEADARLAAAVEVLEAVDYPLELARACAARARHLERRGDPEAPALAARAEALMATVRR